jgi:Helix-turn-helix domain
VNTATTAELPPNGSLLDELDYLEELKAALALDLAPQTLISYRKAGTGPEFTLLGRRVLYSRASLKAWLEAGGTRQADAPVKRKKAPSALAKAG